MSIVRGVKDENGYLLKALPSGELYPLDSRLATSFREHDVRTLPGVLKYATSMYASKRCMATREILSRERIDKDGKTLEMLELGEYTWQTYRQVLKTAEAIGCSLYRMNYKPGDRIAIFAETRADWFIAAMGALQQRISVCTIYTTLGDHGIEHALNETEVNLVFISFELLPRMNKIIYKCPKIKTIIVMEDQLERAGNTDKMPKNIAIIPLSEMSSEENVTADALKTVPDSEDIAIIMYTSGSTGTPKGVELTHTNILAAVIGYSCQMNVGVGDRYLAFLPLAHIMELATETALVALGATIYYSSPHTLTSSSPKIKDGTVGDAKMARPTTMNCVPLLLDRIIKGVTQKVDSQGWLKSTIFHSLVAYKPWLEYIPYSSIILDWLVFQKVKNELGGELSRIIVGGAPLSPQTHDTFRAIFGCSLQIGYGSTETASCATGMNEGDLSTGHCGAPCLNVLLRLEDWEEGNYRTTDSPYPRGEIVIGGVCVAKGYFKLPKETEENFFIENGIRWFRTGDIAEMDNCGCMKIIDRKKDLVKLKHGEYIALGNAETILKTANVVDNICIFADSTRDQTVAVVVPILPLLRKIAANNGVTNPDLSLEELCVDDRVIQAVLKELQLHGKKGGLTRWEIPAAVHLTNELWTPDTGLVTAALKLRRKQIGKQYQSMVLDMYNRLQD